MEVFTTWQSVEGIASLQNQVGEDMKAATEQIIRLAVQTDETIMDKGLIEKVLAVLSGTSLDNRLVDVTPMDRVLSRSEVQSLFGFKSPKSVDQYARKNIFERVTLPGNSRACGYSESSVRKALASRNLVQTVA